VARDAFLCVSGRNAVQVGVPKVDDELVVGVGLIGNRAPRVVRNVVGVALHVCDVQSAEPIFKLRLENRDGVEALAPVGDQLERRSLVGGRAVLAGEADKVLLWRRGRHGAEESYPDHHVYSMRSAIMDAGRTFRLLTLAFPTSVIAALLNVGLSSAAFFLPRMIGGKLPDPLRKMARLVVASTVSSVACSLALWVWGSCGSKDLCTESLVEEPACLKAQSVTVVAMLLSLFVERTAYAFCGVSYTRMARVADSAGLAIAWLFLSERDPLSVLAIDTVLLRKTVYLSPRLGRVLVSLCGVSLGCVCALSAGGQCETVAVKNAAGGALLALLVPFA